MLRCHMEVIGTLQRTRLLAAQGRAQGVGFRASPHLGSSQGTHLTLSSYANHILFVIYSYSDTYKH